MKSLSSEESLFAAWLSYSYSYPIPQVHRVTLCVTLCGPFYAPTPWKMPLLLLCRSKKASKRISVPLLQINDKSLGVLELWFLKHASCAGSVRLEDVVPKRMTLKSLKSRSKVEKETLVTLAWCIQLEGFCLMFWAFSWAVLWTSRHEPDTTHNTPLADHCWSTDTFGDQILQELGSLERSVGRFDVPWPPCLPQSFQIMWILYMNRKNIVCSPLVNLYISFFGPFPKALAVVVSLWASRRFTSFCFAREPWSFTLHRTVVAICSAQVSAPPKLPTPIEERGKGWLEKRWHVGEV